MYDWLTEEEIAEAHASFGPKSRARQAPKRRPGPDEMYRMRAAAEYEPSMTAEGAIYDALGGGERGRFAAGALDLLTPVGGVNTAEGGLDIFRNAGGALPAAAGAGLMGLGLLEMLPGARAVTKAPFDALSGAVRRTPATAKEAEPPLLGPLDRLSTRQPSAKKVPEGVVLDDASTGELTTGLEPTLRNEGIAENLEMITDPDLDIYPGFKTLRGDTPEQTAENVVDHMAENMTALHDLSESRGIADLGKEWYVGANRIASELGQRFGVPRETSAAVLAVMSPQKDWYQNVALAERIMKAHADLSPRAAWTPEMDAHSLTKAADKAGETAWTRNKLFDEVRGTRWGDLETPEQKALWLRAYDEAHMGGAYREVSPDGDILDYSRKKDGSMAGLVHQDFGSIAKAIRLLDMGDAVGATDLSLALGDKHKIRNFFNNIHNPASPLDVTADTHQIAAGSLAPYGSSSTEVGHGLAAGVKKGQKGWVGKGEKLTGQQGAYGLVHEATNRAANMRGVLPREMQSISWEQLRALFPPELKQNKVFVQDVRNLWSAADRGDITPAAAREEIIRMADEVSGGRKPTWMDYTGNRRSIARGGAAAGGLSLLGGLATAEEAPDELDLLGGDF